MDSATIEKVATTVVIAGAAFAASKVFEVGWKVATGRPIPAEENQGRMNIVIQKKIV